MTGRDEFKRKVVLGLANRAGHRCSNPDCRRETSGPDSTAEGSINIGVAAHITAAAAGGPRFDPSLKPDQRSAAANGIWLCQSCAKLIDSDEIRFTKKLLLCWKSSAETLAKSRLQSPERPQGIDEPILVLPSMDPSVSWLPFSARGTIFVGRDAERAELEGFLLSDRMFSWWLLVGAAGTGKSRLALELCRDARPKWSAGFLSRADGFTRWSYFRPSLPALIVIDYVASRATDASALVLQLARSNAYLPSPVRVLLVERDRGSWWPRFLREESQSESTELIACQHDEPLRIGGLAPEALRGLAADIASSRQIPWTDSMARSFETRMRTVDPHGRPLFAMMVAANLTNEGAEAVVESNLLRLVLKKEAARRRNAISDDDRLKKVENLVTLATLVGGLLPRSGGFAYLAGTDVAPLLPDPDQLDRRLYCDLVAATSGESFLAGLQPDILGERFLLDRLAAGSEVNENAKRLLVAAWTLQPDDLCDFVVRVASDFPDDAGLDALCDLPLMSAQSRSRWARLVGDLVRVANRSTHWTSQRLLKVLREQSDKYAEESELRRALALAELYLGNILLFSERNYARASVQFESAIARAGAGSEIEAAATNNRGILHQEIQDEDNAFADWSDVIAREGISDEARACSLNNRADIFARRGNYGESIRDRSEVLALRETSPDRRYIALIRRSRSYTQIGRSEHALRDLECILSIEDISPQQKSEARVARGALYRDFGFLDLARDDFEAVLASIEVFPGTFADALVEMGELARLERDAGRAREYLDAASTCMDVEDSTLVEVLIVRARLFADEADTASAESVWQSVLTNPNATIRQRLIAANRGVESNSSGMQWLERT